MLTGDLMLPRLTRVVLAGLAIALSFALQDSAHATSLHEVKKLTASDAQADDRFGRRIAISGDTAIVGAADEDAGGDLAGAAYIFESDSGGEENWGEIKKLVASDADERDFFGRGVAVVGNTALVTASGESAGAGAVYVFERDLGGMGYWGELKKLTTSEASEGFGLSVALSGGTAIIGSSEGFGQGAAYIFERDFGGVDNWGEVKKITASDIQASDNFSLNVAISGDIAIVGSHLEDAAATSAGAAYIFERDHGGADNWGEVKKLTSSDSDAGDLFGSGVALSGDTALVGANHEDPGGVFQAGAAYVFRRDEGGTANWGEVTKIVASDAEIDDNFGVGTAISGDTAFVGAPFAAGTGAVYLFERDHGGSDTWGEAKKLTASDAQSDDRFGIPVAIDGDTAIVGAVSEDAGGTSAGAAYVFQEPLPPPVGGIALDSDARLRPLETSESSGSFGLVAWAMVTGVVMLAVCSSVWFVRKRLIG